MKKYFTDSFLKSFWKGSEYEKSEYISDKPTQVEIELVENELGYKLPESYIELMLNQNGGIPVNNRFPSKLATSWAKDHVAISGILGIGHEKAYTLCGELGSQFMIEEWGYPKIGIYFGDCPSAGHDMICLDYRDCGNQGEPKVVHVDQENNFTITPLADSFEEFIKGLRNRTEFD